MDQSQPQQENGEETQNQKDIIEILTEQKEDSLQQLILNSKDQDFSQEINGNQGNSETGEVSNQKNQDNYENLPLQQSQIDDQKELSNEIIAYQQQDEQLSTHTKYADLKKEELLEELNSLSYKLIGKDKELNNTKKELSTLQQKYTMIEHDLISFQSKISSQETKPSKDDHSNNNNNNNSPHNNEVHKDTSNDPETPKEANQSLDQSVNKQGGKKSEKSGVMMSVEDLMQWDAKIKALQKSKKQLEKENKTLKQEKEDLAKQIPTEQNKNLDQKNKSLELELKNIKIELEERSRLSQSQSLKNDINRESLEESRKTLTALLDDCSQNYLKAKKEKDEWKEKYQGLKEDFNAKIVELQIQRESAREKFNLEMAFQQQVQSIANLKQQINEYEQKIHSYNSLHEDYEILKIEYHKLKSQLAQQLKDGEEQQKSVAKLISQQKEFQSLKEELEQKVGYLEKQGERLKRQNSEFEEELQQSAIQLEDNQNEQRINAKKFQNELREVKQSRETLLQSNKELSAKNESLEKDVFSLRELHKKNFHSSIDSHPETAKKEKIILESLSIRNQELEALHKSKEDLISHLEKQVKDLTKKVENKAASIQLLSKELFSKNPQLEELQDWCDKEDINEIKQYKQLNGKELQDTMEKIAVENVRLRGDLMNLGKDLNNLIRQQK